MCISHSDHFMISLQLKRINKTLIFINEVEVVRNYKHSKRTCIFHGCVQDIFIYCFRPNDFVLIKAVHGSLIF